MTIRCCLFAGLGGGAMSSRKEREITTPSGGVKSRLCLC
jgi:hypothetical protein